MKDWEIILICVVGFLLLESVAKKQTGVVTVGGGGGLSGILGGLGGIGGGLLGGLGSGSGCAWGCSSYDTPCCY